MKKILILFAIFFPASEHFNICKAQQPTFTLKAKNIALNAAENEVSFDIIIEHTDANYFEYASAQLFLTFNPSIANGGTLSYKYDTAGAHVDFPTNLRPRNPSINGNLLRLAANSIPQIGSGYILPQGIPKKILRMKLSTTASKFALENFDLLWRTALPVPFTKIYSFVQFGYTEISSNGIYSVENNDPLPVELASFTASVNRNNVYLQWMTNKEINNEKFEIERMKVRSNIWSKTGIVQGSGTTSELESYTFTEEVLTGSYKYRLKQLDFNGNFKYYDLNNEVDVGVPEKYGLLQNYPNPFNPVTNIKYDLPTDGIVSMKLFDVSGKEMSVLIKDFKPAGYYTIQFNGSNLPSGIYFYTISVNNFLTTKKMMLLK